MLFETLNHLNLFLIFLLCGIIGGLIFDIGNFIKFLFANKKIPSIIIDFIQTLTVCFILFIFNLKFNYGCIRLFPVICFLLSFIIQRLTLGKIIAKVYIICYNFFNKVIQKFWSKLKSDKNNKVS